MVIEDADEKTKMIASAASSCVFSYRVIAR